MATRRGDNMRVDGKVRYGGKAISVGEVKDEGIKIV